MFENHEPDDAGPTSGLGPVGRPLSAREREILLLLADGHTNRSIAEALNIAIGTVKRHLANAYPKLGVDSRLAAALRVRELESAIGDRMPRP
ncbi:helix-turn-helix transcriptional regulator [Leifsonia sp. NPDC080035]|uniref:Helix-turn-helix transcriptional regulator n=1 Tax=Leifsonia sp. NPDC080035 TaxID=3143936 RepID=A0AAU7GE14_9MICO